MFSGAAVVLLFVFSAVAVVLVNDKSTPWFIHASCCPEVSHSVYSTFTTALAEGRDPWRQTKMEKSWMLARKAGPMEPGSSSAEA